MKSNCFLLKIVSFSYLLTSLSCGSISINHDSNTDLNEELGAQSSSSGIKAANPFEDNANLSGDDYPWGFFIRGAYQTTNVSELPIPIYTAYFTEDEIEIVQDAIDIANQAVGFDVFELTHQWDTHVRLIYKVNKIEFEDEDDADFTNVVGYTFSRNIYMNGLNEAGRVVTDWAIEIKASHVNKWVIAHELGHALGIQKHAKINYEEDTLEEINPNSLMAHTISFKPELEDYNYMMQKQGEILLEYMDLN